MRVTEDPLASLVARSVGGDVRDVRSEDLAADDGIERKRLHFTRDGRATALLFERGPRGMLLEAQLLPFLARKTDRVPLVRSRGIPPAHVTLGPWLLLEDLGDAPAACEGDPADIARAKAAIERAVAKDAPALKALGVVARTALDLVRGRGGDAGAEDAARRLAELPIVLVHGDLSCARAHRAGRGVVLTRWSKAYLGCGLLDAARLAADLGAQGRKREADTVIDAYVSESGLRAEDAVVRAARHVDALLRAEIGR